MPSSESTKGEKKGFERKAGSSWATVEADAAVVVDDVRRASEATSCDAWTGTLGYETAEESLMSVALLLAPGTVR